MHLLLCLAARPGVVASREDLLNAVWPDVVVNEDSLTRAISDLRRALGDDPRDPQLIETIPKGGYRIIAPVESIAAREGPSPGAVAAHHVDGPAPDSPPGTGWRRPSWGWVIGGSVVVILAAGAWSLWETQVGNHRSAQAFLEGVPFTSERGLETHPAISPDGTRVAFVVITERGTSGICIRQPHQLTSLQLTDVTGTDYFPTWSPGGERVAFVRVGEKTGIYSMPSLGGTPIRLTEGEDIAARGLDWSPDGGSLVFARYEAPETPRHLVLFDLETRETRRLTWPPDRCKGDGLPTFSPDGHRIAFVRSDALGLDHVRILSLEDGEEQPLDHSFVSIRGMEWTPNGRELIVGGAPEGFHSLWRVSVKDGEAVELLTRGDEARFPTLARDGSRLVYSERNVRGLVVRMEIDGLKAGAPQPFLTSTRKDYAAHYSRDGRRIAFISTRLGPGQIWICDADGSHPMQLTEFNSVFCAELCWSPDGTEIALSLHTGDRLAVHRVSVADGRAQPVTTSGADEVIAFWSKDGQWIYYREGDPEARRYRRTTPDGTRVEDVPPEGARYVGESHDGKEIYFVKPEDHRLWARPADGSGPERVLVGTGECGWTQIEPVEGGLFYTLSDSIGTYLGFCELPSEQKTILHRFAPGDGQGLEVSPDGRTVLFDYIEYEADLILVEGFETALR